MRGILCGAVMAFLVAASNAHAAFNFTSQLRSVFASAGQGGGGATSDLKQTAALGPWSETATAIFGNEFGSALGSASQISDLAGNQISMSGTLSAAGTAGFAGGATSVLDATFSLLMDTPYVSAFSTTGPISSNAGLFGPSTGQPLPYNINGSGVLPAGDYRLLVSLGASAGGEAVTGTYAYGISIAGVPEPSSAFVMLGCALTAVALQLYYRRC